ncbi:MAG: TonB-dependent receptor [Pseudomonadota bacterium]
MSHHCFKLLPISAALALAVNAHANDAASSETAQLMEITITANPLGRTADEMVQPALVLAGETLDNKRQGTLGQTLAQELGVSSTDFGSGAGRPVIRGQAGPRVDVLSNGVGAMDVSNLSPDHAVAINPLIARQIEVLKGPATLLYGSSATGGAVNVSDSRLATEVLAGWSGAVEASAGSVANENQVAADLNYGIGNHQLHFDMTQTRSDDYRIPGNSHVDGSGERKRLPNSDTELRNGAISYSHVDGLGNSAGIALSRYENSYGLPNEETAFIDMKQDRVDAQFVRRNPNPSLESVKLRVGAARYEHTEFEAPGVPGTIFNNDEYQARVEAVHKAVAGFRGVVGVQLGHRDFAAKGDEAYVPTVITKQLGVFVVEERKTALGKLEIGARVDSVRHEPDTNARNFTPLSLSLGTVYDISNNTHAKASLTHAERAPASEELYALGVHIATGTFEAGNPDLKKERAVNLDIGIDHHVGDVTMEANLYHKRVHDYIYGEDTGIVTVDGEDFQRLEYRQQGARFSGYEAALTWALQDRPGQKIDARLFTDGVRGELDDGNAVPRLPPYRVGVSLHGHRGPYSGNLSLTHAARQDRVGSAAETETAGYNLLNADLSYAIPQRISFGRATVFLRGTNLLNDDIRRSTSFIKDMAPAPGRGGVIGIRISF